MKSFDKKDSHIKKREIALRNNLKKRKKSKEKNKQNKNDSTFR